MRRFLTIDATKNLVVSFILSWLDYCNSILAGISTNRLDKLQKVQNFAARLVLRKSRYDSPSYLFRQLHWLPVKARIEYEISTLCYKCINDNSSPSYLRDLLVKYEPPRSLRSNSLELLNVPRFSLNNYGKRSFSVSGPLIWNRLPLNLKSSTTLSSFKSNLKTYLFARQNS